MGGAVLVLVLIVAGYFAFGRGGSMGSDISPVPQEMTLSGEYTCLPHMDTSGPQTLECANGLQTDAGDYYAVNFGESMAAAQQFQSGVHVTVEGTFVPKEALSTDFWQKYNMKGIFTVTKTISTSTSPAAGTKLNIDAVCRGALAYSTFPDAASAEVFVAECKDGKHPEVIERYKADNHLDGATI